MKLRLISMLLLIVSSVINLSYAKESALRALFDKGEFIKVKSEALQKKDDPEALFLLGIIAEKGLDSTIANKDEALKYIEQSAMMDYTEAMDYLGQILFQDKEASEEAEVKALEWVKKAAQMGDLTSKIRLALFYRDGFESKKGTPLIEKNLEKAIQSLKELAIDNSKKAQETRYYLALIYLDEKEGKQDIEEGIKLLNENVNVEKEESHGASVITLAHIYNEGKLVPKDEAKAFDYFVLGYHEKIMESYYVVGMAQKEGKKGITQEIPKDIVGSFLNLRIAAKEGHGDAMYRVAEMYFYGIGTEKSLFNAYIWTAIAEKVNGHETKLSDGLLELMPRRERQDAIDKMNHQSSFYRVTESPKEN